MSSSSSQQSKHRGQQHGQGAHNAKSGNRGQHHNTRGHGAHDDKSGNRGQHHNTHGHGAHDDKSGNQGQHHNTHGHGAHGAKSGNQGQHHNAHGHGPNNPKGSHEQPGKPKIQQKAKEQRLTCVQVPVTVALCSRGNASTGSASHVQGPVTVPLNETKKNNEKWLVHHTEKNSSVHVRQVYESKGVHHGMSKGNPNTVKVYSSGKHVSHGPGSAASSHQAKSSEKSHGEQTPVKKKRMRNKNKSGSYGAEHYANKKYFWARKNKQKSEENLLTFSRRQWPSQCNLQSRPQAQKPLHKLQSGAEAHKTLPNNLQSGAQQTLSYVRTSVQEPFSVSENSDDDDDDSDVKSAVSESSLPPSDTESDTESSVSSSGESEWSKESGSSSVFSSFSDVDFKLNSASNLPNQMSPRMESVISVLWDIENCAVPSTKSAVDIVKKVRTQFYRGRTEEFFIVACDTRNMSEVIERELSESFVTIVHACMQKKNAADVKLQSILMQFQYKHRMKNAAVVLITGDSDFAQFLNEMRYHHLIHITLICNNMARKSLRDSAHECVSYEDFLSDLPNRCEEDTREYVLHVGNLPSYTKKNAVKSFLEEKVKRIKGKVSRVGSANAEVVFTTKSACNRAAELLKGCYMYGSCVTVDQTIRNVEIQGNSRKKINSTSREGQQVVHSSMPTVDSSAPVSSEGRKKKKVKTSVESSQGIAGGKSEEKGTEAKGATLYVFVNSYLGDTKYWEKQFKTMFQNEDITVEWWQLGNECYFLVKFKSLNKAQKAKKVLEKHQKVSDSAPKFLKLVKDSDIPEGIGSPICDPVMEKQKQLQQKIEQVMAKKTKFLADFTVTWNEVKVLLDSAKKQHQGNSETPEVIAYRQKLVELNDQKLAFLNYMETVHQKLGKLNIQDDNLLGKADEITKDCSRECVYFQARLPLYARQGIICKAVKKHQVVILQAGLGSGKSTQICQYLWRGGFAEKGVIICSQPSKLSAELLAKHVSHQMGCRFGSVVGFDSGYSKKKSGETKILYTTDFQMLKVCSRDPQFTEASCIVIDEAHHRTIYTDLLIAVVKKCALQRLSLKVVITSSSEFETGILQKYFSVSDDAVLKIPTVSYPVQDIWLESDVRLGWDYFHESLTVALGILKQGPGDILVFLTTADEAERAAAVFTNLLQQSSSASNTTVHFLHEYMNLQEVQKVYVKAPAGQRKVIFCTDYAGFITVPGVQYVVDCGMLRNTSHDAASNSTVITVHFENKDHAAMRSSCAACTPGGKCYRLYSSTNYLKDFELCRTPEILRLSVGQVVLILMVLGVRQPLNFDFLQVPLSNSMISAVKSLQQLQAVSSLDCSLTERGRRMAFLPLDLGLSDVVLKAIEEGIGYEAIVAASVGHSMRNVCLWTSEKAIDRMGFFQSESDFLSYLHIYSEWMTVPKDRKDHWHDVNQVSSRCLQVSHELVLDVAHTLNTDLKLNVACKVRKDNLFLEALPRIIFSAFPDNVCVFSGCKESGYVSCKRSVSGTLHLYPFSVLAHTGATSPQYVMYDTVLKDGQTYLVNVTAVPESLLDSVAGRGYTAEQLKKNMSVPYVIGKLGEVVMKMFVGKKASKMASFESLLCSITESSQCRVEPDITGGKLRVFVPHSHHQEIEKLLLQPVTSIKAKIFKKDTEVDIPGFQCVRSVISAGLEVKELVLPGEYRIVKVTPANCDEKKVFNALKAHGEIIYSAGGKSYKRFVFRSHLGAEKAVQSLQEEKDFKVKPGIVFRSRPCSEYRVIIRFLRRPCVGRAFISINPLSKLSDVACILMMQQLLFQSAELQVSKSKTDPNDLCIQNVPENVIDFELRSCLNSFLPDGVEISKLIVERKKEFESSKQDVKSMRGNITGMFSQFVPRKKFHVELKTPKSTDREWEGVVFFDSMKDGQMAVNSLECHTKTIHEMEKLLMSVKPVLEISIYCRKDIFVAVRDQVSYLLQTFNNGSNSMLKVDVRCKQVDTACISICGENVQDVYAASTAIQNIIQGTQITFQEKLQFDSLSANKGKQFLKQLPENIEGIYIHVNHCQRTVTVFGAEAQCTAAKLQVWEYVQQASTVTTEYISLKSPSGDRSFVREIVAKFGFNLDRLVSSCDLLHASIDVCEKKLKITGEPLSVIKCQQKIQEIKNEFASWTSLLAPGVEVCPVCCDVVRAPLHRLEICGHSYCEECLVVLLYYVTEVPVTCCKRGCNQLFVIDDMLWALERSIAVKKRLLPKLLDLYLERNPKLKFCPTPYCSALYRITDERDCEFACPSCNNAICRWCGTLYHYGRTCDLIQLSETPAMTDYREGWTHRSPAVPNAGLMGGVRLGPSSKGTASAFAPVCATGKPQKNRSGKRTRDLPVTTAVD